MEIKLDIKKVIDAVSNTILLANTMSGNVSYNGLIKIDPSFSTLEICYTDGRKAIASKLDVTLTGISDTYEFIVDLNALLNSLKVCDVTGKLVCSDLTLSLNQEEKVISLHITHYTEEDGKLNSVLDLVQKVRFTDDMSNARFKHLTSVNYKELYLNPIDMSDTFEVEYIKDLVARRGENNQVIHILNKRKSSIIGSLASLIELPYENTLQGAYVINSGFIKTLYDILGKNGEVIHVIRNADTDPITLHFVSENNDIAIRYLMDKAKAIDVQMYEEYSNCEYNTELEVHRESLYNVLSKLDRGVPNVQLQLSLQDSNDLGKVLHLNAKSTVEDKKFNVAISNGIEEWEIKKEQVKMVLSLKVITGLIGYCKSERIKIKINLADDLFKLCIEDGINKYYTQAGVLKCS